jgi:hypothetical protein
MWLNHGRLLAAEQDNRTRVWHLIDTLSGAEKTAAEQAVAGTGEDVLRFLRTREYPGKAQADRMAIAQLLPTAGPALRAAAQAALGGTPADAHEFLRRGRYVAMEQDERVRVAQVMAAGGPEVKAAAQVALAGPRSYVTYFLQVAQHEAAQRDAEQAAHVAAVRRLVANAAASAATARADAAEAARVAAIARNAASEAAGHATRAADYARQAAEYATQANQSAEAARQSAEQAARSAATARAAAAAAHNSASAAARSATQAAASAALAVSDAKRAYSHASQAAVAAYNAGKDADAAAAAAHEAAGIAARMQQAQERARRQAQDDSFENLKCLLPNLSPRCQMVRSGLNDVLENPLKCAYPANANHPGCLVLGEVVEILKRAVEVVKQSAQVALAGVQLVLAVCGLVPGFGEPCDLADAAISALTGDMVGAGLGLASMVPFLGWAAGGAKIADKLRDLKRLIDGAGEACRRGSSFVPGTPVLLADGSTRPIERIRVGDRVLAADPDADATVARRVTATISRGGPKYLVDLTVDTDGTAGRSTATVTATGNHPFWAPDVRAWVSAMDLRAGQLLRSAAGSWVQVEAVRHRTVTSRVHNLTVADLHTYFVAAGAASALVHNDPPCLPIPNATRLDAAEQATAGRLLNDRSFTGGGLRESQDTAYDYVDDYGRTYDAVGRPEAYQHWDEPVFMESLRHHVERKQGLDFTVLDLTGASSAQLDVIFRYIDSLPPALQRKIKIVGD